jgi:hypothetical protein
MDKLPYLWQLTPKVRAADRNIAAAFFDRRAVEDLKGGAPFYKKTIYQHKITKR